MATCKIKNVQRRSSPPGLKKHTSQVAAPAGFYFKQGCLREGLKNENIFSMGQRKNIIPK